MQRALNTLYPDQCVSCDALVSTRAGLCGTCWADTPFITGHVCDACGAPLPGSGDGTTDHCDDCIGSPRPWSHGRAALVYGDNGRRIVLALKHGDRTDLARPAGVWMANRAREFLSRDTLVVPVPIHWTRLVRRRYNQAGLLAQSIGRHVGARVVPDALRRVRGTPSQDGKSADERFANVADAIAPNPRREAAIVGQDILLVDDVMTSGATLTASTLALKAAGAGRICVVVLARVSNPP